MERDFKFEKWQSIRPFPNQALKDLSTNVYDEAENFALSVSRVDRLSNIIQQSFANGGLYAQDCLMAHHLAYGIDNPPPKPEDPDFRINLDTYTVLLAKLHRKEIDVPPWCTGFGWSGDLPFRGIQSRLSDQIETLMLTQVVSVWTAFETLAGDLWEAALNAHPQGLSDLRGIELGNPMISRTPVPRTMKSPMFRQHRIASKAINMTVTKMMTTKKQLPRCPYREGSCKGEDTISETRWGRR